MECGAALGPYVIDRELGSGGMGTVYLATGPDGRVALKVVHPHLLESADAVARFRREVEIGRSVRHPNVVRTLGGGEIDGVHHLVMEYVEGQTLDALLTELERVPEELCRHIGREVTKGLAAIHAKGALHRDIKPENVLITADHVVKIMDLGVARMMDDALRLSQTGAFVGSLRYAAPECFRRELGEPDHRADLHALGLVLYELATGDAPYAAPDVHASILRVLEDIPRRAGELNPQLSPFFEEVVHTLLVKDPRGRFSTADDLLRALESGESGTWWGARAKALRVETRRPLRRIRIPRETDVYGRDDELALLRGIYERARSGDGQVLLIEGEAGIGKSRLVDELVARLQADGEDLSFVFGSYPPSGAATAAGAFSRAFREQLGDAGSAAYLRSTPLLVPAFDALLRGEGVPEGALALNRDSLQTCFVDTTRALAAERVTIVLVDDLHFAPDEGRALFGALAQAVAGHRVLLIGTLRPGVPEEWLSGLSRLDATTRVAVPRLGPKHLVEMLGAMLRSDHLAHALSAQIALKSDGNPFFASEIVRGLREGQFIRQLDDGTWATTRVIDEIQIPSSVLDLVSARVANLAPEDRDLLDVASCCGHEFDPALLALVLGTGRIPLLKQLAQIERAHGLVRASGRRFVFDHHQVQEALYGKLPEMLREEYHATIATSLERQSGAADAEPAALDGDLCVALCRHFLAGAEPAGAHRYLGVAMDRLVASNLDADAIALADRALAVDGLLEGGERVRVLVAKAERATRCGRPQAALAALDEAEQLTGVPELGEQRLQVLGRRAVALEASGRAGEGCEVAARGIEGALALGHRDIEVDLRVTMTECLRVLGRSDEALVHARRALELTDGLETAARAQALEVLGLVLLSARSLDEAAELFGQKLELAQRHGWREMELGAVGDLANVEMARGRYDAGLRRFEELLDGTRQIGARRGEVIALVNLGAARRNLGDPEGARRYHQACAALCREIGARYPEAYAQDGLAGALVDLGHMDRALVAARQGLAIRRQIGDRLGTALSLLQVGQVASIEGLTDEARSALTEAAAIAQELGDGGRRVHALARLACLPGGDVQAALDALAATDIDAYFAPEAVLWSLWKATGDAAFLRRAKQALDRRADRTPEEYRESMLANVHDFRVIVEDHARL